MTLDAVPEAWDGAPRLAGVDVLFIKDPLARLAALKTGEIDLMLYVPADAVPQIKGTRGCTSRRTAAGELVLIMNHSRPPFDQVAGAPGGGPGDRPQADGGAGDQRGVRGAG